MVWLQVVADKFALANGIIGSADNSEILVVNSLGMSVRVYDRNPETNALVFREEIDTYR